MKEKIEISDEMRWQSGSECYHYGMWFGMANLRGYYAADILIKALRPTDNPTDWRLDIRFRQVVDDQVFESKDKKSWWEAKFNGTEEEMVDHVQTWLRELEKGILLYPGAEPVVFDFLEMKCTGDRLRDVFLNANRPWLHVKPLEKGEAV